MQHLRTRKDIRYEVRIDDNEARYLLLLAELAWDRVPDQARGILDKEAQRELIQGLRVLTR